MTLQPARDHIAEAFEKFRSQIPSKAVRDFQDTTLKDVWAAIGEVEERLAMKGHSRSLRRLKPLLDGLEHYGGSVEVVCNGTPYLPWIWAPIKLCIQIASDHIKALEKLVKAYAEIGEALPRFDKLSNAFRDEPDFQLVLAAVYRDILEFHERAYKLFNTSAWDRFFESSWTRFQGRFGSTLDSLKQHSDLVDREAMALHIVSFEAWRKATMEGTVEAEKERFDRQLQDVLTWLDVKQHEQENLYDDLSRKNHPGTSDWLLRHSTIVAWMKETASQNVLWLTGKPGSGKSVLCAQLIQRLQSSVKDVTVFYICSMRTHNLHGLDQALRHIAAQLVKKSRNLVGFLFDEYVTQRQSASIAHLKQLIIQLLAGLSSTTIVIDGLDECQESDQKALLSTLLTVASKNSACTTCKVAVFSRGVPTIERILKKALRINLNEERVLADQSIGLYVRHEMDKIRQELEEMDIPDDVMRSLENDILDRADGMFLWVRLVLASLEKIHNLWELQDTVKRLPKDILKIYDRILQRMRDEASANNHEQKLMHIFSWILHTQRPLKVQEILDGVSLCSPPHQLNTFTKNSPNMLDICKPLVDIAPEGIVSMVHFSAKHGPFMTRNRGLHDIALACTAYVKSSLQLLNDDIPEIDHMRTVAMGFHNLHGFANAFWLDFLVQLAESGETLRLSVPDQFQSIISELCTVHSELSQKSGQQMATLSSIGEEDPRESLFVEYEPLRALASEKWTAEKRRRKAQLKNGIGESSTENVSSLFDIATTRYQALVERLLEPNSEQRLPELSSCIPGFRKLYAVNPFVCQLSQCPRRFEGFPTQLEKIQHEKSHCPRLMCNESSCPFATSIGFKTIGQLRRHIQNHHTYNTPIPSFPRSSRVHSSNDEAESSDLVQDWEGSSKPEFIEYHPLENPYSTQDPESMDAKLSNLKLDTLPSSLKRSGEGWVAGFNPNLPRRLDVDLIHQIRRPLGFNHVYLNDECNTLAFIGTETASVYSIEPFTHQTEIVLPKVDRVLDSNVDSVVFSLDHRSLAVSTSDGHIWIYSLISGEDVQRLDLQATPIVAVQFDASGENLLSGTESNGIQVWSVQSGHCTQNIGNYRGWSNISLSSTSQWVAYGSSRSTIAINDFGTGEPIKSLGTTDEVAYSVAFSCDSGLVVGVMNNGNIQVWRMSDEACVLTINPGESIPWAMHPTFDGAYIVSPSLDGGIDFWDVATGHLEMRLSTYKHKVVNFAVSKRANFAAATEEGMIRVWKYNTSYAEIIELE